MVENYSGFSENEMRSTLFFPLPRCKETCCLPEKEEEKGLAGIHRDFKS